MYVKNFMYVLHKWHTIAHAGSLFSVLIIFLLSILQNHSVPEDDYDPSPQAGEL